MKPHDLVIQIEQILQKGTIFDQSSRTTKTIRLIIASHLRPPLPLPTPSWTLPIYANLIQQRAKPVHFLVLILNRISFNDTLFFFSFVSSIFSLSEYKKRSSGGFTDPFLVFVLIRECSLRSILACLPSHHSLLRTKHILADLSRYFIAQDILCKHPTFFNRLGGSHLD